MYTTSMGAMAIRYYLMITTIGLSATMSIGSVAHVVYTAVLFFGRNDAIDVAATMLVSTLLALLAAVVSARLDKRTLLVRA